MANYVSKSGTLAGSAVDYTIEATDDIRARSLLIVNQHASNEYTFGFGPNANSPKTITIPANSSINIRKANNLATVYLNGTGGYKIYAADEPAAFDHWVNSTKTTIAEVTSSASGQVTSIDFYEDQDNGSSKVSVNAPSSLAADRTLTLPSGGNLDLEVVRGFNLTAATSGTAAYVDFYEDTDNGTNRARLIAPSSTADVTVTLPAETSTLANKTELASTANAKGASLIGLEDAAGYLSATDVEAALAEFIAKTRIVTTTVNADAGNTIAVDIQIKTFGAVNVAAATYVKCKLYDSAMLDAVAASWTMAETGAGSEVTTTAKPAIVIKTDANGAAQLTVTDVATGSNATLYLELQVVGWDGPTAGDKAEWYGIPQICEIDFDT